MEKKILGEHFSHEDLKQATHCMFEVMKIEADCRGIRPVMTIHSDEFDDDTVNVLRNVYNGAIISGPKDSVENLMNVRKSFGYDSFCINDFINDQIDSGANNLNDE